MYQTAVRWGLGVNVNKVAVLQPIKSNIVFALLNPQVYLAKYSVPRNNVLPIPPFWSFQIYNIATSQLPPSTDLITPLACDRKFSVRRILPC